MCIRRSGTPYAHTTILTRLSQTGGKLLIIMGNYKEIKPISLWETYGKVDRKKGVWETYGKVDRKLNTP